MDQTILNWLLEEQTPEVRLRTLKEYLKLSEDDEEVPVFHGSGPKFGSVISGSVSAADCPAGPFPPQAAKRSAVTSTAAIMFSKKVFFVMGRLYNPVRARSTKDRFFFSEKRFRLPFRPLHSIMI